MNSIIRHSKTMDIVPLQRTQKEKSIIDDDLEWKENFI